MVQEDKELLLMDLSARLPYGVVCIGITYDLDDDGEKYIPVKVKNTLTEIHNYKLETASVKLDLLSCCKLETVKPYLRPMSSMTEDEKRQYEELCNEDIRQFTYVPIVHPGLKYKTSCHRSIDWLNKNMFDYRRLIEKGLALEAPKDMYNIKEK